MPYHLAIAQCLFALLFDNEMYYSVCLRIWQVLFLIFLKFFCFAQKRRFYALFRTGGTVFDPAHPNEIREKKSHTFLRDILLFTDKPCETSSYPCGYEQIPSALPQ